MGSSRTASLALPALLLILAVLAVALVGWLAFGPESGDEGGAAPVLEALEASRAGAAEVPAVAAPSGPSGPVAWLAGRAALEGLDPASVRVRLGRLSREMIVHYRDARAQGAEMARAAEDWLADSDWPEQYVWARAEPVPLSAGAFRLQAELPAKPADQRWRAELWWAPDWSVPGPGGLPLQAMPVAWSPPAALKAGEEKTLPRMTAAAPVLVEAELDPLAVPPAAVQTGLIARLLSYDPEEDWGDTPVPEVLWEGPWPATGPLRQYLSGERAGEQVRLEIAVGLMKARSPEVMLIPGENHLGLVTFEEQPGRIRGRLLRKLTGEAVPEHPVTLHPDTGERQLGILDMLDDATARSDENGVFEFPAVPPGKYLLTVHEDPDKDARSTSRRERRPEIKEQLEVAEGATTEVILELRPPPAKLQVSVEGLPEGGEILVYTWTKDGDTWPPRYFSTTPFEYEVPLGRTIQFRALTRMNDASVPYAEAYGEWPASQQPEGELTLRPYATEAEIKAPEMPRVLNVELHPHRKPSEGLPVIGAEAWMDVYRLRLPAKGEPRQLIGLPAGRYTARALESGTLVAEWEFTVK